MMEMSGWQEFVTVYLGLGLLLFTALALGLDGDPAPRDWWRRGEFALVASVVVLFWPWLLLLMLLQFSRRQAR